MINKFIECFKEALDIEKDITPETNLSELAEWDSVGYISIMSIIDDEYEVVVNASQLKNCKKIGELYELILQTKK